MPRCVRDDVEADDRTVFGVVELAVLLDQQTGNVFQVGSRVERVHDVAEGQFALTQSDGVGDALFEVELRGHGREPAAPDHGQIGEALANGFGHTRAVRDLESEDARAGEAQGSVAQLHQLFHVVVMDHRVDDDDLVTLLIGEGRDLEQFERQQVGCDSHTFIRVGPVRHEHHDALLAEDHFDRVAEGWLACT